MTEPRRIPILVDVAFAHSICPGIPASTFRAKLTTGEIPSIKRGKKRLIKLADLLAYLGLTVEDVYGKERP